MPCSSYAQHTREHPARPLLLQVSSEGVSSRHNSAQLNYERPEERAPACFQRVLIGRAATANLSAVGALRGVGPMDLGDMSSSKSADADTAEVLERTVDCGEGRRAPTSKSGGWTRENPGGCRGGAPLCPYDNNSGSSCRIS